MNSSRLALLICFGASTSFAHGSELDIASAHSEVALAPGGSMETAVKIPKHERNDGLMRRDTLTEHQHFAPVEAHKHSDSSLSTSAEPPALSEVSDGYDTTSTAYNHHSPATSPEPYDPMGAEDGHWVSCGGHRAPRCRVCTILDPDTGKPFPEGVDKGPDWCRGNCKWYDGECQSASRFNTHVEHNDTASDGKHATTGIPDILNPELTVGDEDLIHMAANRAISEADYEARQREANQAKEEEEKRDKLNKFLKIAICSCAACLCCCAFAAVFAVVRYARGGKKKQEALAAEDWTAEDEATGGEETAS